MSPLPVASATRYVLRFSSLTRDGRDFAFPCDARGHVEISNLSERSRNNYFYARAAIGREFAAPALALAE